VDASPLRRMERAYGLAASPEMRDRFTAQEKLGDAITLDLFLLRSFRLGVTTLSLLLSVNNLLGDTGIVYNGYEQMRVMKKGTAPNLNWQPLDSRYMYNYGRTYYVSVSYRF
ncbi:TonB-dependent receptor, partial [Alistipes sp. OttesenSCG-928-B03]|nr:TonB-dependent receptor [Alistipes sp. OttesenSCG-928-B03]